MAEFPIYEPEKTLRRNLFTDPLCKSASNWSSAKEVTSVDLDGSYIGAIGGKAIRQRNPAGGALHAESTAIANVTAGEKITIGANLSTQVGCGVSLRIYWYDSSGYMSSDSAFYTGRGIYDLDRVSITGTAPAGAVNFRISVWGLNDRGSSSVPDDIVVLVSGITAERGVTDGSYFDGDTQHGRVLRRNLAKNPLGPGMTSVDNLRSTDIPSVEEDGGRKVAAIRENGTSTSIYLDQSLDIKAPAGTVIHGSAEVKVTEDISANMRLRFPTYNGASMSNITGTPDSPQTISQGWVRHDIVSTVTSMPDSTSYARVIIWPSTGASIFWSPGQGFLVKNFLIEYNTTGPFFDGDTAPSGDKIYRWTGTPGLSPSEEVRIIVGAETRWLPDGTSELYMPEIVNDQLTGVMDVGISTEARLGLVTDVYSRSREKIKLRLALPDRQLIAGERVELAASAQTASAVTWRWRQITGPTVELKPKQNTLDFIAPDVDRDTTVRIGVYAGSEDGRNRSDWHYFDLTIQKALARYRDGDGGDYSPVSPKFVGYERGPREIWNDVIPPNTFTENPKYEPKIIDLGIKPDDVAFSSVPPVRASRGAVYVDPVTGDIYRNFGEGYNETDDTTAAPRANAFMVNPATGDISKWIED